MSKYIPYLVLGILALASTKAYPAGSSVVFDEVGWIHTSPMSGGASHADQYVVHATCTADDANGSYPATAITAAYTAKAKGLELCYITTNPGSTAPTDDYDIVLNGGATSVDILGGEGTNRDTANNEQATPKIGSGYGCVPIWESSYTLAITGNSVNSATTEVWLLFRRPLR